MKRSAPDLVVLDRNRRVEALQSIARIELTRALQIPACIGPARCLRLMRNARSRAAEALSPRVGGASRLLRVALRGTSGQEHRKAGAGQKCSQHSASSVNLREGILPPIQAPRAADAPLARISQITATNLWPGRLDGYNWRLTTNV
jgi:hypothetical protein